MFFEINSVLRIFFFVLFVLVVNEQGDKTGHANKKPINLAPLD
jgi:hypothetical protein